MDESCERAVVLRSVNPKLREGKSVVDPAMAQPGDPTYPAIKDIELVKLFQAFSDPVRLELVRVLHNAGGTIACSDIPLSISKSTLSHHLKVLREAGVVHARVDGDLTPG
jgi:Helix-turn-helix domain